MTGYSKIVAPVDSELDSIHLHATTVWEYTELSYNKEYKSAAFIAELLESKGFAITDCGIGGLETTSVARFKHSSSSLVVGIMAEYDALPSLGNYLVPMQVPAKYKWTWL
jgi:aminobenzoyl-glutamate utilization protein B